MAAGEIKAKVRSIDFHIPQLMNLHSAMLLGKSSEGTDCTLGLEISMTITNSAYKMYCS